MFFFYIKEFPAGKQSIYFNEFTTLLRISSMVMITNVIQLLAYRVDYWLIQHFWNKYEVGVFAQANKFANLCWILPNVFAQLLMPKFASLERNQIEHVFNVAFYFNLLIGIVAISSTYLFYSFYLELPYRKRLQSFYIMLPGYFFLGLCYLYRSVYFCFWKISLQSNLQRCLLSDYSFG